MYFSHFILKHCFKQWFAAEDESNPLFIRMIIFLIAGMCGGLPAVVWALHVLYHHRRIGGRISAISIFLLLSDLLELIFISVILAFTLGTRYIGNCNVVFFLFGVMLCGHHLHQLVALEYVFCRRYPALAHIFSPLCSTVLCIIVVLLVIVLMFLNFVGLLMNMCLSLLPVVVLAITCLLTCKTSSDHVLPTNRKPRILVLCVAMFTMFFLNVPWLLKMVFDLSFGLDCLVSLRVIADPLLCVLVCRESFWVLKAQERSDQSDTP